MTTVAVSLFRRLWPVYAVFAALLVTVVAVVGTLIGTYGSLTDSAWNIGAASTTKWLVGSIGFILLPSYLRQYVANGVTRREFLGGGLLFGIGSAAGFALLVLAGFGVERLIYGATGLMDGLTEPYPVHSAGSAVAVLVRAFLIYLAHICTAWLVAVGFYRYGALTGLLLIPPSLVPAFGSELFFGTEWSPVGGVDLLGLDLPFAASALLTAVLVVAGCAIVHQLGRAVAIRGKIT
ncbi:hypothetical protein [Catenuloplanes japonicus]|uniref:hypothetical protein n=1 Tax=Catenuloplanes japonicus TaxID=33876 RepID=UPI0005278015|nr:hypothetical protein [Catenuloplanes japonicus]